MDVEKLAHYVIQINDSYLKNGKIIKSFDGTTPLDIIMRVNERDPHWNYLKNQDSAVEAS